MSHTQPLKSDCPGQEDETSTGPEVTHGKYLLFRLDNKEYAVEVSCIREVIHYTDMTEVPNTSACIMGVISLRGTVIPILDFRVFIGLTGSNVTGKSRIIIIRNGDNTLIGLLVDCIEDVISISSESFVPVPDFIGNGNMRFFKAAFEYRNKFILLIESGIGNL